MSNACIYADQSKNGFIPMSELRNIVKSFKLPIQDHLLQKLIQSTKTNDCGDLAYEEFIRYLNWRDHPSKIIVVSCSLHTIISLLFPSSSDLHFLNTKFKIIM